MEWETRQCVVFPPTKSSIRSPDTLTHHCRFPTGGLRRKLHLLRSHPHPGKSGNKVQSGLSVSLDRSRVTDRCGKGRFLPILFTTQENFFFFLLTVNPGPLSAGLNQMNQTNPTLVVIAHAFQLPVVGPQNYILETSYWEHWAVSVL